MTEETKEKMSIAKKLQPLKTCPYCKIECSTVTFNRWHGYKCKLYKKV